MNPATLATIQAALTQVRCNACRTPYAEHHAPSTCPQYVVDWSAVAVLVGSWVGRLEQALDTCEGNRGAFSCHEPHDLRCPKARAATAADWRGEWVCVCGRDALDAALAALPWRRP